MQMYKILLLLTLFLLMVACAKVQMDIPKGFAHYSKEDHYFKMISADAVTIRVNKVDLDNNKENIDAELWFKETKISLQSKVYVFLKKENIDTKSGLKGIYSEYSHFYNGETYLYSVTLFNNDDQIYKAEVGGQKKYFDKRRKEIMEAMRSFRVE